MRSPILITMLSLNLVASGQEVHIDNTFSDPKGNYRVYGELDKHGCFTTSQTFNEKENRCEFTITLVSPYGETISCDPISYQQARARWIKCYYTPQRSEVKK